MLLGCSINLVDTALVQKKSGSRLPEAFGHVPAQKKCNKKNRYRQELATTSVSRFTRKFRFDSLVRNCQGIRARACDCDGHAGEQHDPDGPAKIVLVHQGEELGMPRRAPIMGKENVDAVDDSGQGMCVPTSSWSAEEVATLMHDCCQGRGPKQLLTILESQEVFERGPKAQANTARLQKTANSFWDIGRRAIIFLCRSDICSRPCLTI
mmetsp:Transcript_54022/g.115361  ORF Transcript_54022/g.115361 Transcript_54022/m.115361 type:complete len:209 (-) Transcript_54022:157-783(-)